MTSNDNQELAGLRRAIVDGMIEYMEEGEVEYGREEVDQCARILDAHLEALDAAADREAGLACVERTVKGLNELNDRVGGELIETDQREHICAFIAKAGALRGFNEETDDPTEEWREW